MSGPRKRRATPKPSRPSEKQASGLVVGIGASAGGLEALRLFFQHMPPAAGMAFVVVQHLDPHHGTLLPELLAKVTRMSVAQVEDETPIEADRVYVIPPNASLALEGGVLRVQAPVEARGARTPIDGFFRSLAEDQAHNAVCILLSGTGSDGTVGLRAVKEHGGMAMAQALETAKHDSMPRSAIATGLVDHVLPVHEMPAKLLEYAEHLRQLRQGEGTAALREEARDHLAKICVLLQRKTGHDFRRYKDTTLVRRIQRRMQVLRVSSVRAYVERLREDPREVDRLFKDLLIGVTHFFRDPEAFAALEREVVPRLLDQAGPDGTIRVWTPGCASGEEAYSVAIPLREAIAGRKGDPRVQIFASDIDDEALEVARQGRYPEGIADHVSAERLERFFVAQGGVYQVVKELREMCIFSSHNLIKDPPFSRLDLVVCRNVLIYLEPELQEHVIRVFHYALRSGGYLFLGPSENVAGRPETFRVVDRRQRIFQRRDTVARQLPTFSLAAVARQGKDLPEARPLAGAPARKDPDVVALLERLVLDEYGPAWVVVNSEGDAVYFSPHTGKYLEPPTGTPHANVLSLARKSLRVELRTAIHQAAKLRQPVVHGDVAVDSNGEVQRINLIARPLRELGKDPGLFLVVFQELGPPRPKGERSVERPAGDSDQVIAELESELRLTKEHLQATVEEVETSNEELQSANEELLSTNEELQSANEELQTSQEELQSVNEELETVNAELRKKIEELDAVNSDLQNLFESTRIATIFVDGGLRIKRFTPAAREVFNLIEGDLGRPISDIASRVADGDLAPEIREVLRTRSPSERQVRRADGSRWFILRMLPYERADKSIDGVVINFVDITELKRMEQRARLAAIVESAYEAIVGSAFDGTITSWNPAATRMFGFGPEEAIGAASALYVPADERLQAEAAWARARQGESQPPFESERLAKDGRRIPVSVSISAVRDEAGTAAGAAAAYRDISELKRAQEALQEELRRRDHFLAMLSHELRNPLVPLRNCAEILQSPAAGAEEREAAQVVMRRQTEHLTRLVDQLLDLSRVTSGKIRLQRELLDLVEVVRAAVEDARRMLEEAGLEVGARLDEGPLWVRGDPVRLAQVAGNLLHNAAKFTPRGGRVEVTLRTPADSPWAALQVRDSGAGIEPAMLPHLFQPFTQGDRGFAHEGGGLGLGLALVKSLVESHGGTVAARSEGSGRGAEFTVRLPLAPPPAAASASAPASRPAAAVNHLRILLIEDNPDTLESMRLLFELGGHEVATAADGAAGLRAALASRPDVVFCDLGLPAAMDGYAVASACRRDPALRSVHLVALSGYGQEEDQRRSREAGFDRHLTKPADPALLERLLADLPRRPPAG